MEEKENMTEQEKAISYETQKHIINVRNGLGKIIKELVDRQAEHDYSKLSAVELYVLVEYTPKLAESTYGSDQYKEYLAAMKPMLDHHYANNKHHPEHFKDGVSGMTLIDLLEMLTDWKATTLRHNNGDIMKSIEINKTRFGISDQLVQILKNTVEYLQWQK
jgi:hypothetical protein